MKKWFAALGLGIGLLASLVLADPRVAGPRIEAVALMKNAAMLRIDGQQKLLRAGGSAQGVRLISANPKQAVVEVGGQRHTLTLSRQISGNYQAPVDRELVINRNNQFQYLTLAEINGRPIEALVDTGANLVALSSQDADAMGIDYRSGRPSRVATASGTTRGWHIILREVNVGGIRVPHVPATVIPGDFPHHVLLGMTFLQHVHLREQDGVLYLRAKY